MVPKLRLWADISIRIRVQPKRRKKTFKLCPDTVWRWRLDGVTLFVLLGDGEGTKYNRKTVLNQCVGRPFSLTGGKKVKVNIIYGS